MRRENILRMLLFVVFFSIGVAVLSVSILCDELLQYYTNKQLLKAAEEFLACLESLNTDYDLLLQRLEEYPDIIKHIAPAILGTQVADLNTVYPRAAVEQLAAVKKALAEDSRWVSEHDKVDLGVRRGVTEPVVCDWLVRCSGSCQRVILFLVGGFLILISFVCFGPAKQKGQEEQ